VATCLPRSLIFLDFPAYAKGVKYEPNLKLKSRSAGSPIWWWRSLDPWLFAKGGADLSFADQDSNACLYLRDFDASGSRSTERFQIAVASEKRHLFLIKVMALPLELAPPEGIQIVFGTSYSYLIFGLQTCGQPGLNDRAIF